MIFLYWLGTMIAGIVGVLAGSIYERHRTLHGVFQARCQELTADVADRDITIDDLQRKLSEARRGSASSGEPWQGQWREVADEQLARARAEYEELQQQAGRLVEELTVVRGFAVRNEQGLQQALARVAVQETSLSARLAELRELTATLPGSTEISGTRPCAGAVDREGTGG